MRKSESPIKKYLSQAFYLDKKIDLKGEQLTRLRSLAERSTATLSDMPHGTDINMRVQDTVIKIITLQTEINEMIDDYVDLKREIQKQIDGLPDEHERLILEMRYINGWKWEKIQSGLDYERAQVFRLHGYALQNLQNMILNDTLNCVKV